MTSKTRYLAFILLLELVFSGIVSGNQLLDRIAIGEGTDDATAKLKGFDSIYDVPFGLGEYGKPSEPLTEMTISQVLEYQTTLATNQVGIRDYPSGAVGKYQITQTTLSDLVNRIRPAGISLDSIFNAETQEKLAQALLEERGYVKWLKDEISDEQFKVNLANEWASVVNPVTGKSSYDEMGQKAVTDIDTLLQQTKLALTGTNIAAIGPNIIPVDPTIPIGPESKYEAYRVDAAFEYYSQGIALAKNGDYEKAVQAFESATNLRPDYASAWNEKGLTLINQGLYDEAKQAFDKAIEFSPKGSTLQKEAITHAAVASVGAPWVPPETKPTAALDALGIGFPQLSPSTSGISWSSDQNKEGSDGLEASGATYSDKANDVWYVDAFYWSGDRNLLEKPAAPYRFASGEINTYGYNWIFLPYSQTGITFTPGYGEWAVDTLASMGISIGAGVGPLDDGQVGGGLGGGGGGSW